MFHDSQPVSDEITSSGNVTTENTDGDANVTWHYRQSVKWLLFHPVYSRRCDKIISGTRTVRTQPRHLNETSFRSSTRHDPSVCPFQYAFFVRKSITWKYNCETCLSVRTFHIQNYSKMDVFQLRYIYFSVQGAIKIWEKNLIVGIARTGVQPIDSVGGGEGSKNKRPII